MYNLPEYSDNYEESSGSLYQFKRDEPPPMFLWILHHLLNTNQIF